MMENVLTSLPLLLFQVNLVPVPVKGKMKESSMALLSGNKSLGVRGMPPFLSVRQR